MFKGFDRLRLCHTHPVLMWFREIEKRGPGKGSESYDFDLCWNLKLIGMLSCGTSALKRSYQIELKKGRGFDGYRRYLLATPRCSCLICFQCFLSSAHQGWSCKYQVCQMQSKVFVFLQDFYSTSGWLSYTQFVSNMTSTSASELESCNPVLHSAVNWRIETNCHWNIVEKRNNHFVSYASFVNQAPWSMHRTNLCNTSFNIEYCNIVAQNGPEWFLTKSLDRYWFTTQSLMSWKGVTGCRFST